MSIRRFEVERISVTSSRPFEAVVAALKAAVGRMDVADVMNASKTASTFAAVAKVISRDLGNTGLMLFMELDHGALLRKETGRDKPKVVRLVIGNPLIMIQMVRHVPDAGSYAPVTILVDERPDGVHLSYDTVASHLSHYGNAEALKVACDLDAKVEALLVSAAG